VSQKVCRHHGVGPSSTWDLWWISDTGTRFSLSTAVLVCRYHLTTASYPFTCHQPHIIASDSFVKQHTKKWKKYSSGVNVWSGQTSGWLLGTCYWTCRLHKVKEVHENTTTWLTVSQEFRCVELVRYKEEKNGKETKRRKTTAPWDISRNLPKSITGPKLRTDEKLRPRISSLKVYRPT